MNPKCHRSVGVCDTFSARNADSTRLFLMPITRAFHGLPSSGREPHITTPLRENAAVQCGKIAHRMAEMGHLR